MTDTLTIDRLPLKFRAFQLMHSLLVAELKGDRIDLPGGGFADPFADEGDVDADVIIPQATGTIITDYTARATTQNDGVTNQAGGVSAAKGGSPTFSYSGKTYSGGKRISKAIAYGGNDTGFIDASNPSVTITLYGKQGAAPSSGTDGTVLGSLTFTDTANESAGRTITSSDRTTIWDHVWIRIVPASGTATHYLAEVEFYEAGLSSNQSYNASTDLYSPQVTNLTILDNAMKSSGVTLSGSPLLTWTGIAGSTHVSGVRGTDGKSTGKWYFEFKCNVIGTFTGVGIVNDANFNGVSGANTGYDTSIALLGYVTSQLHNYGATTSYGAPFTAGDTVGVAVDLDAKKIFFSKNGVWLQSSDPVTGANPAASTNMTGTKYPWVGGYGSNPTGVINFGATPFTYSIPSGYSAWGPGITQDMSIVSKEFTATAEKDFPLVLVQATPNVAITLNTDLLARVCRDDTEDYATVTLEQLMPGWYYGLADLSAKPSGTAMRVKVDTDNAKNIDVSGWALDLSGA